MICNAAFHRRFLFSVSTIIAACLVGCSTESPAPAHAPGTAAGDGAVSSNATAAETKPSPTETKSSAATPSPAETKPGELDLSKLPVPADAKSIFANADVAMYAVEMPPEATKEACRKLLVAQGWSPYGAAGDVQFFKQNLWRLSANVGAAPAQGGKTMITFGKERMSVDLPAPTDVEGLQYSDTTTSLFFDAKAPRDDVAKFYRDELAKAGWKATTDRLIETAPKFALIFRNPAKDLLTLEMQDFEGKTRTTLRYETAEQVAKSDEAFKKEMARRDAERNKPLPKIAVVVPAGAQKLEQQKNRIEFQVPTGTAKAVVDGWRKSYAAAGWTEKVITADDMIGTIQLDKENLSLSLSYTDIGFVPAEVSISTISAELVAESK